MILNAHLEDFNELEQMNLRCGLTSTLNKATLSNSECDYKCHVNCDGCTRPNSVYHCKQCRFAKVQFNSTTSYLCVRECSIGFQADPLQGNLCVDVDECREVEDESGMA